jgi:hypothetical protein
MADPRDTRAAPVEGLSRAPRIETSAARACVRSIVDVCPRPRPLRRPATLYSVISLDCVARQALVEWRPSFMRAADCGRVATSATEQGGGRCWSAQRGHCIDEVRFHRKDTTFRPGVFASGTEKGLGAHESARTCSRSTSPTRDDAGALKVDRQFGSTQPSS